DLEARLAGVSLAGACGLARVHRSPVRVRVSPLSEGSRGGRGIVKRGALLVAGRAFQTGRQQLQGCRGVRRYQGTTITDWEMGMAYRVEINGEARELDVPAEMPLLWALRNELGMPGTKFGCGIGACGACTVHVDGVATRSCALQVGSIGDRKITTIEALAESPVGRALQQAWLDEDVM